MKYQVKLFVVVPDRIPDHVYIREDDYNNLEGAMDVVNECSNRLFPKTMERLVCLLENGIRLQVGDIIRSDEDEEEFDSMEVTGVQFQLEDDFIEVTYALQLYSNVRYARNLWSKAVGLPFEEYEKYMQGITSQYNEEEFLESIRNENHIGQENENI